MFEVEPVANPNGGPPSNFDFGVDPLLLSAAVRGTFSGLAMTRTELVPVGTSRLTTARHAVTIMVGLVGIHSGNVALNLSEAAAKHLASGLLGTTIDDMNEVCIDAIMELGNQVAGGIKSELAKTNFNIEAISLPSVVLGQSYAMAYSRGIRTVSVDFELPRMAFSLMNARFLSSTLSLMYRAGA